MGKKCWIPSPSTVLFLLLCILTTQTTIHTHIRPALILCAKTRTMPRYKKLYTSRGFLCTCVPLVPGDSKSAPAARKAVTTLYEFVWMRASWGTLSKLYIPHFLFSGYFSFTAVSETGISKPNFSYTCQYHLLPVLFLKSQSQFSLSSKLNSRLFHLSRLQNPSNTDLPATVTPHPTLPRHNLISFLLHAFQPSLKPCYNSTLYCTVFPTHPPPHPS